MKPGSWAWTCTPRLCGGLASAKAEKSREGVPGFCSIRGMNTDQLHGVLTAHCWWGWIRSLKLFIGINIRVGWWWLSIWEQNVKNGSIIHALDSLNPRITYQSECASKTLWGVWLSPSQTYYLCLLSYLAIPHSKETKLVCDSFAAPSLWVRS